MMTVDRHRAPARLHHRVALIVCAEARDSARELLRCAAYDTRVQLSCVQEQWLGLPPARCMLSGEFTGSVAAAARLVQGLARLLEPSQLVLIRLDTLGGLARSAAPMMPAPAMEPAARRALQRLRPPSEHRPPATGVPA
ncbi:hypothetical protein [Variovorax terrae]|uniref:Uncharacterized protein n=1 Tax=Variovorax terrae TaxID=2923278 RepID=A0A9X2AS96_9BURK|nr:hypothetical protein [Variovorax terrae]MCJ0765066.1 hypothetical protein [Variovorax terrae]